LNGLTLGGTPSSNDQKCTIVYHISWPLISVIRRIMLGWQKYAPDIWFRDFQWVGYCLQIGNVSLYRTELGYPTSGPLECCVVCKWDHFWGIFYRKVVYVMYVVQNKGDTFDLRGTPIAACVCLVVSHEWWFVRYFHKEWTILKEWLDDL